MKHRIFIAVNLPEDIKENLVSYQKKIDGLFAFDWDEASGVKPIRWTKKENLHITLVFLGYVREEELLDLFRIVKEVASRNKSFEVHLNKICYAPPKKMPPRMVWAIGERSSEFTALRDDLERSLAVSEKVPFVPENRAFSPHITLGRIKLWQWRQIEPEERPDVSEDISLSFRVNSVEIMESRLKRGGAKYTVLKSYPLSDRD